MKLRDWFATKLAEVWGFDVAGFSFALILTFVLAILNRMDAMLVFLAIALFFLGFFAARQIYTPKDEKPEFGLKAMTPEEFEKFRNGGG